jgi:PAS domain S-box-containing protein
MKNPTRFASTKSRAPATNEQFALTLRSIGDGVIATDTAARITLFNATAEQLTGWRADEALGKSLLDVFHIINYKTRQPAPNPAENVLTTGTVIGLAMDTALIARDGSERLISSSVAPIRDRANAITGVVLVFRDVTRLRRAEEALQESQAYNRSLIDSSLDMIIAVDLDRHIIEFNRAAQETFGYAADEIIGKDARILYADPDQGRAIQIAIAEHGKHSQEVINRRKNGELFPALVSASHLKNAQGDVIGVMGVSRDITQLKLAEQAHLKAERLAALGRLAAALAHEINNPLQAIRSTMDLVLDYELPTGEREENLRVIRQEIERLSEIASRILQFSRPATAPRRMIALGELIEQTLALARKQMQHAQIRVATDLQPLPLVLASPEQMVQVFLNLTLNAVEAINESGALEIRARVENADAVIEFINDGPIIPPDTLPHLFEPFFTTKPDGSGLGLSVSRNIVEQHGGTIRAENLSDTRGVAFRVRLPLESLATR